MRLKKSCHRYTVGSEVLVPANYSLSFKDTSAKGIYLPTSGTTRPTPSLARVLFVRGRRTAATNGCCVSCRTQACATMLQERRFHYLITHLKSKSAAASSNPILTAAYHIVNCRHLHSKQPSQCHGRYGYLQRRQRQSEIRMHDATQFLPESRRVGSDVVNL